MPRKPYPTDLTDAQWQLLAPLLPPPKPGGRPRTVDIREIMNAILYVTRNGIPWRALPHDLPHPSIVYHYFCRFVDDGVWEAINDALRRKVRQQEGRNPEPSAGCIDSQSAWATAVPGWHGYDAGKRVNGRKRSVIVDTVGLVLRVVVHAADISDLVGGKWVIAQVQEMGISLKKLWGDQHYGGKLVDWVRTSCGWEIEVVSRPEGSKGFVLLPRRWVVERTFGWLTWFRRLSKDYESYVDMSEAFIYVAMIHLMLRRLTNAQAF